MIIEPRIKGFICTTAHPKGCQKSVETQIDFATQHLPNLPASAKPITHVLVIGATTGYGLASAITASFGYNAKVLSVGFERNAQGKRTASAGLYNTDAYLKAAKKKGLWAKTLIGDAFSPAFKEHTMKLIKEELGKIDLIIYSLAAPSRVDPTNQIRYQSVLKPLQEAYQSKNIDLAHQKITQITIEPANNEEKEATVKVMGGEDWQLWIESLMANQLLADSATTIAYSYIGPKLTYPIYKDGTIGQAKINLKNTAAQMNHQYKQFDLKAYISVNKALVTQASSAIPVVPLYISILFDVMKKSHTHEGCIEQMIRLFERLFLSAPANTSLLDKDGYIRLDDWEMDNAIQTEVMKRWEEIDDQNLLDLADIEGYQADFLKLFGFGWPQVNYTEDIEPTVENADIIFVG